MRKWPVLVLDITWTSQDNVEVQTVDTDGWIVLDTQVNVFLDTESEVTAAGEVVASQFVFTDLSKNNLKGTISTLTY